ncbi:PREDICTED: uncharacterized protein LOC107347322 isoform X1 [Acropora digitifera]|uniref:uncharacterized protein LOC107347322 isoform X1 n=1 Tax=Acropora digitifera TaxID=70779 RepID=UPI00077A4056|nr:PREDICTED: uncharacterized protein LOC107347322 isoform X1 [Acropora digitifera]
MEPCSKPIVMALSITQIVMSAAFFVLGMVDRFYVKFAYTSFAFLPCWIFPLFFIRKYIHFLFLWPIQVFPVGIMGLALSSHQTVRSPQLLKHAIWSLCVVCIICSALILHFYTTMGLFQVTLIARVRKHHETAMASLEDDGDLVRNGEKLVYTEKEKAALVVFAFVIIFSVIEIVLAAAMIKISETTTKATKLSPNFTAYYQTGESHQPLLAYPVGQQQVRVDVWDNQRSQRRRFSH